MKPYYEQDGITIYHGDCLEVLPHCGSVDVVFTSPPYNKARTANVGVLSKWKRMDVAEGYASYSDDMPWVEYFEWQSTVLDACWKVIQPSGAIFYNHKAGFDDGEYIHPLSWIKQTVRQVIIWSRPDAGINFSPAFYRPTHELIIVIAPKSWRLKSRGSSAPGDVWLASESKRSDHPAPFPTLLPEIAIETTGARSIIDPFMGSGTTLVAAKNLSRKAIGIEIEERYCEIAAKRLSQTVMDFA